MDNDKAGIALKYLELARAEILEKGYFINQTLGAYLFRIASWFYQPAYKPLIRLASLTCFLAQPKMTT